MSEKGRTSNLNSICKNSQIHMNPICIHNGEVIAHAHDLQTDKAPSYVCLQYLCMQAKKNALPCSTPIVIVSLPPRNVVAGALIPMSV